MMIPFWFKMYVQKYEMQPCSTALREMRCSDFILAMKIFLTRLYIPIMHIDLVGGIALFYGVEKKSAFVLSVC